jgi:hypothetical protein
MAIEILKLVADLNPQYLTLPYLMEILRGVNSKPIRDAGHHRLRAFNACHQLTSLGSFDTSVCCSSIVSFRCHSTTDVERLISRLLIDGFLKQEFFEQRASSFNAYLRPGSNAVQLTSGASQRSSNSGQKISIELTIRIETNGKEKETATFHARTIEQISEECLAELRQLCSPSILPEALLKDLVRLMP